MADSNLKLVQPGEVYELGRRPETLSERVRRMHAEAQVLACEEVDLLRATLQQAVSQAEAIRDCPACEGWSGRLHSAGVLRWSVRRLGGTGEPA